MKHEDFVTYYQAEKLSNLGFDLKCIAYYDEEDFEYADKYDNYNSERYRYNLISAPTLAQAQKWLRKVKDIIIGVDFDNYDNKFTCHCYKKVRTIYGSKLVLKDGNDFDTYEQALSAGIDAALELLK